MHAGATRIQVACQQGWRSQRLVFSCRIPDDCIDEKRYPLFMARAVLQELIESLQSTTGSAKP